MKMFCDFDKQQVKHNCCLYSRWEAGCPVLGHWWNGHTETGGERSCGTAPYTLWPVQADWNWPSTRCTHVWTTRLRENHVSEGCGSSYYRLVKFLYSSSFSNLFQLFFLITCGCHVRIGLLQSLHVVHSAIWWQGKVTLLCHKRQLKET